LNGESLHSIILLNFPCNSFCSVSTGVKVDGNIAAFRSELQADEFTCQYLRVSNAYERNLVDSATSSPSPKTWTSLQRRDESARQAVYAGNSIRGTHTKATMKLLAAVFHVRTM
jgi:hypothetical protein